MAGWNFDKDTIVINALVATPADTKALVEVVRNTFGRDTGVKKSDWSSHSDRSIISKAQNLVTEANAQGRILMMPPAPEKPRKLTIAERRAALFATLPKSGAGQKKTVEAAKLKIKNRKAGTEKAKATRKAKKDDEDK